MVYENKYAPDGRMLQRGYTNNDGTKGLQSFTYDADGHLLQATWSTPTPVSDTIYNYDSQGRLVAVTGQGDWITTFEYDDQGRKTRIMKSTLKADTANPPQPSFSMERENVDLFAAPPPGGWVTTSFNERDEPLESRVYGSDGQLTIRLTRSYDHKGLVLESAYVIESSEAFLSPATRERLRADPETSAKMEAAFAEFLGPERVFVRESYVYDDQGRVSEKRNGFGPTDKMVTEITYNDHGDEAKEIQTTSHPDQRTRESVVNFSYQYDSFGNWTEKIVSSPATATEPSKVSTIDHRTITYY